MIDTRVQLGLVPAVLFPVLLAAQDRHSVGLNLGIVGSQQVGITYHVSSSLTLRPAVFFDWSKRQVQIGAPLPGGGGAVPEDITSTALGLDLDVLFPGASSDGWTSYFGLGADVSRVWFSSNLINQGDIAAWGLSGIFGARVTLINRLAGYGEIALRYANEGGGGGSLSDRQRLSLGTSAVGLLFYLN